MVNHGQSWSIMVNGPPQSSKFGSPHPSARFDDRNTNENIAIYTTTACRACSRAGNSLRGGLLRHLPVVL